jgi:hypothetical protein
VSVVSEHDEVGMVYSAVRQEADKWDGMGKELTQAKYLSEEIYLTALAFFAGNIITAFSLQAKYSKLQNMIIDYLGQGSDECHEVADALRTISDHLNQADLNTVTFVHEVYG